MNLKNFFTTKEGIIVIGQWPNWPLKLWALFTLLALLPLESIFIESFGIISSWFLFVWAYLELRTGVNTFRKVLGGGMILYMTIRLFL